MGPPLRAFRQRRRRYTTEELRQALRDFSRHYNETWLVAQHGYRTPAQVRAEQHRGDPPALAELPLAA